jgi:hypothetical protein
MGCPLSWGLGEMRNGKAGGRALFQSLGFDGGTVPQGSTLGFYSPNAASAVDARLKAELRTGARIRGLDSAAVRGVPFSGPG